MLEYAYLEGCPVRFNAETKQAFIFGNDAWHDLNYADAFVKAKLVTEADYNEMFPDLPPLPE